MVTLHMPRIIVSCTATGAPVPTGHRTQDLDLASMIGTRSFRCPTCNAVHAWSAQDAHVEVGLPEAARDRAVA